MEETTGGPQHTEALKAQGRPSLGPRRLAALLLLALLAGPAAADPPLESAALDLSAPLVAAAPRAAEVAARHKLVCVGEVWRADPPSRQWAWRGPAIEVEAALGELERLGELRGKQLTRRPGDHAAPATLTLTVVDTAAPDDAPFGRRLADTLAASWAGLVAVAKGVALVGVALLPWVPALVIVALVLRLTLRRFARYLRRQVVWLFSPAKPPPPPGRPPGPGELFPGFPVR